MERPPTIDLPARVLVVDDSDANRRALKRLLSDFGHTVTTAADGRDALDKLDADPNQDLILLDVDMPHLGGIEVLERLQADARFSAIPVVMVSGLGDMEAISHCIAAGADDFIHKPFDLRLMRARVASSLAKKRLRDWRNRYTEQLEAEEVLSQRLISSMLPDAIAQRLRSGERVIAEQFDDVSVLFADIVGFTARAAVTPPGALVTMLNQVFSLCDRLVEARRLEKIKTIGDAYMAVGNLPEPLDEHVRAMAELALDIRDAVRTEHDLQLRIGIHCGPAVAGVIGTSKPSYDVWGDTINIASRLEHHGLADHIHVSTAVRERLEGVMRFESRGEIVIKGRGSMHTHFLAGRR